MDDSADSHKQAGWEHFCTVLVLIAEYLAVRHSIVWLAWGAAIFLCFAIVNYARYYLGLRNFKIVVPVAILIILSCTYFLTRERKSPVTLQAQSVPVSQSPTPVQTQQQPQSGPTPPVVKKLATKRKAATPPPQDNSVHVDHGSKIEQQSSGDCSPNIVGGANTVNCPPPPPPPLHYTWSAEDAKSTKPEYRFAKEITVQTNVTVQPVSIHIEADSSISDLSVCCGIFFQLYTGGVEGSSNRKGFVQFDGPAFRPDTPLVVTIWSQQPLSVLNVSFN